MRAVVMQARGGPEVLEVADLPVPEPGPKEVRVRLKAAALNHLDVWVRKGVASPKLPLPHVLGADGSGVVDAVGPGVEGFAPGDEVVINPGLSCGRCERCQGDGVTAIEMHLRRVRGPARGQPGPQAQEPLL